MVNGSNRKQVREGYSGGSRSVKGGVCNVFRLRVRYVNLNNWFSKSVALPSSGDLGVLSRMDWLGHFELMIRSNCWLIWIIDRYRAWWLCTFMATLKDNEIRLIVW